MNRQPKATAVKQDAKPVLTPKLRFPEFRDVGGWKSNQLNNVCAKITQGGTPDTSKPEYWGGAIRWMTPAEMGKSESSFISSTNRTITELGLSDCSSELLPVNSVILSVRAPIGHLAINTAPMAINQGCKGLIAGKSLDHYFLFYSLAVFKVRLIDLGAGNTFKELSGAALKSFEIPIPSPAEQQKIAECLTSLDEVIAAQSQKIDALKTHKKGLMQQLFPREGETVPRLRFPEFQNAPEWEERRLGEICDYWNGASHENAVIEDGQFWLISLNSINIEGDLKAVMKRLPYTDNSLKTNDLVMVLSDVAHGNFLGLSEIIPNERFVLNQRMGGLRIKLEVKGDVKFLKLFINFNQKYFKLHGQGSSQLNLSKSSVVDFPILFPTHTEQQRIATCLTSLDNLMAAQSAKLEALKTHKKGLMQQLFPSPEAVET